MNFHFPTFYWQFQRRFLSRPDVDVYHNNLMIYVIPAEEASLNKHELLNLISDALLESLREPLRERRRTRRSDLLDGPLEGHLRALQDKLLFVENYLEIGAIATVAGERVQYKVDCRKLEQVIILVRKEQDRKLAIEMLRGELVMSIALLTEKIYHTQGRSFSQARIREMFASLYQNPPRVEDNGNLRTKGRDVIQYDK